MIYTGRKTKMSENISRDSFAGQLNTKFHIHFTPENIVETELTEVTELKKTPRSQSFSILFLAPINDPFIQGVYRMEHPELGSFELFIVPVGKNEKGIKYEALFNHLVE